MRSDLKIYWLAVIAALAGSCVPPKAIVVAPPSAVVAVKNPHTTSGPPDVSQPLATREPRAPAAASDDEGPRMPDMLVMPTEGEFKATHPGAAKSDPTGNAVISHPPTDPPSRVKPKDPKAE